MKLNEAIMQVYGGNKFVIDRNVEGLTHEDSLLNPQPDGNNLNWLLGHILAGRSETHEHLNIGAVWSDEQRALYASGSDAITSAVAIPFSDLLAMLDRSQVRLTSALAGEDVTEHLARPFGEGGTIGQRLLGLAWHETYHAGQTDYLRRLAGFLEGGVR